MFIKIQLKTNRFDWITLRFGSEFIVFRHFDTITCNFFSFALISKENDAKLAKIHQNDSPCG